MKHSVVRCERKLSPPSVVCRRTVVISLRQKKTKQVAAQPEHQPLFHITTQYVSFLTSAVRLGWGKSVAQL